MKKYLQKKLNNEKGMTLIELLAVIVIIAIIAAIAIPAIGNIIENSRYSAVKSDALNALNAANIYFAENADEDDVTIAELENGYLDNAGTLDDPVATSNLIKKNTEGAVTLTYADITYSGSKKVSFSNATVEAINADEQKGSDPEAAKTISAASSDDDGE
ncbi:prepilin-type N-terminal cleavage/methylation domain-containing protein [Planococcus beijingensis]|uniref:prepilin-type N-terminal cleavage/methylation domain-containing protein n=1 Tax=Planococcus beijingensis TaxID=2782551 RepID=UPI00254646B1|nr:prepilin-type N-terminal cleavage/methylation domain-containing protein [Planococcus beijingensis]